jgi:hypothetical protein
MTAPGTTAGTAGPGTTATGTAQPLPNGNSTAAGTNNAGTNNAGTNNAGTNNGNNANPSVNTSNTAANAGNQSATPASGHNSFTAGQARGRLERNGFTNVTGLKLDRNGVWRGQASRNGQKVDVWLDYKGAAGQS